MTIEARKPGGFARWHLAHLTGSDRRVRRLLLLHFWRGDRGQRNTPGIARSRASASASSSAANRALSVSRLWSCANRLARRARSRFSVCLQQTSTTKECDRRRREPRHGRPLIGYARLNRRLRMDGPHTHRQIPIRPLTLRNEKSTRPVTTQRPVVGHRSDRLRKPEGRRPWPFPINRNFSDRPCLP
jgi:hypothetical protein